MSSSEVGTLISALGCGFNHDTDDFNIQNLRYGKIIIMTDADVDGAHIRTLLLTLLARKMKPLFDEGRIYIAQPPLYKIKKGKSEKYISNDIELNNYLSDIYFDSNDFSCWKNKIDKKDASSILINYRKVETILLNISKSKDRDLLKSMCLLPPLDTSKSEKMISQITYQNLQI